MTPMREFHHRPSQFSSTSWVSASYIFRPVNKLATTAAVQFRFVSSQRPDVVVIKPVAVRVTRVSDCPKCFCHSLLLVLAGLVTETACLLSFPSRVSGGRKGEEERARAVEPVSPAEDR